MKIIEKMGLDETEAKKVGLTRTATQISWKDVKYEKVIELSDEQFLLLVEMYRAKDDEKSWTISDAVTANSLKDKLELLEKKEK